MDLLLNLVPLVIPFAFAAVIAVIARQPLWAEAFRRMRSNRLAMVALSVIGVYVLVAMLDSVGWKNDKNAPYKTVIDRIFEKPQERYYSAPFAKFTTGEPEPHELKQTHILGTDGSGSDVFYLTLKGARTALIIGLFTSLIATPLALLLGMPAGYFGNRRTRKCAPRN